MEQHCSSAAACHQGIGISPAACERIFLPFEQEAWRLTSHLKNMKWRRVCKLYIMVMFAQTYAHVYQSTNQCWMCMTSMWQGNDINQHGVCVYNITSRNAHVIHSQLLYLGIELHSFSGFTMVCTSLCNRTNMTTVAMRAWAWAWQSHAKWQWNMEAEKLRIASVPWAPLNLHF